MWFITWVGLFAGNFEPDVFEYVVALSIVHFLIFLVLFSFDTMAFPVQLRFAYLLWVFFGTYIPSLRILLYIAMVGLATNLFIGYCPLARMMYLLPWYRKEPLTLDLIKKIIFTPPVKGQFKPS